MLRNILLKSLSSPSQPLFRQICKRLTSSKSAVVKSEPNIIQTITSNDELDNEIIDWDNELAKIKKHEEERSVFAPANKDDIKDFAPYMKPTFNFAAYVDKSRSLQELVKLGVDLSKLESKRDVPEFILKLDYEKDIKPRLLYLHDIGVPMEDMGMYITKNPSILKEDIDDLHTRIYYLQYKRFEPEMIKRIVSKNPYWLSVSTSDIDRRLGYFQKSFKLTGDELRALATMQPKLITFKMDSMADNTFTIREEMGFSDEEIKQLLLNKPRIWMQNRSKLLEKFHYVHNTMGISHEQIVQMPDILYAREFIIRQRHSYLKHIGRDQYDHAKPNFVSLKRLVEGTDAEFCINVAKTTIQTYNLFLKSQ